MVKLHGPNVTVRALGTNGFPFAAEQRRRRPETVDKGSQTSRVEQCCVDNCEQAYMLLIDSFP